MPTVPARNQYLLSGLFWSFISIAFAFLAAIKIYPISKEFMNPFLETCLSTSVPLEDIKTHDWLGIGSPIIDHFLCFITPFFAAVAKEKQDIGGISTTIVMGLLVATFIVTGIESLRRKAHAFVFFFPLVFIVGQLISIAVAFPLLWLPSYFLSSTNRFCVLYGPQGQKTDESIRDFGFLNSLDGVFFLMFATWGLSMTCLLPVYGAEMYQSFWIALFQFAPLIGFFVTFFTVLYGTNKNLDEAELASITAVKLYKIFGAILFLLHCFTLYLLAQSNTFSIKFFLETSSSSHLSPSLFLFADGLFLFLSLSIFIGAEQGFFAFLGYLALSLLIGPASCFLLYAVNREELLMKRIKQVHETSQSKKKN